MKNEEEYDPARASRWFKLSVEQQERERAAAKRGVNGISDADTRDLAELLFKGFNSDSNSYYSNEIRAVEAAEAISSLIQKRISEALSVNSPR